MQITIWMKENAVIYMGGDPRKGQKPLVTASLDKPQLILDEETNTMTIVENK